MKVLLLEDIDNLGYLGDVVEVADGYAPNYLLPYGKVSVPTEAAIKNIGAEKAARAELRKLAREKLEQVASEVEGAAVSITAAANEQGHLFGSVTEEMIAAALRDKGFEIANDVVDLEDHIKKVGTTDVTLKFAVDLKATVQVSIVAEGAEETEGAEGESEQENSQE